MKKATMSSSFRSPLDNHTRLWREDEREELLFQSSCLEWNLKERDCPLALSYRVGINCMLDKFEKNAYFTVDILDKNSKRCMSLSTFEFGAMTKIYQKIMSKEQFDMVADDDTIWKLVPTLINNSAAAFSLPKCQARTLFSPPDITLFSSSVLMDEVSEPNFERRLALNKVFTVDIVRNKFCAQSLEFRLCDSKHGFFFSWKLSHGILKALTDIDQFCQHLHPRRHDRTLGRLEYAFMKDCIYKYYDIDKQRLSNIITIFQKRMNTLKWPLFIGGNHDILTLRYEWKHYTCKCESCTSGFLTTGYV